MNLPLVPPFPPMEAKLVHELPHGADLLFEPKWDGFRCMAFRDGASVYLQSKGLRPLTRYFPEIVEALAALPAERFVLDGELVVAVKDELDFDQLLQRIHPAESRIRRLAAAYPARLLLFDVLLDEDGEPTVELPLEERRERLERLYGRVEGDARIALSPATRDRAVAARWLAGVGHDTDGVIAKQLGAPYRSGERDAMYKIKRVRTADCVVGGYRPGAGERSVGSLLLGLYDESGLLHYVGFTSALSAKERAHVEPQLRALTAGASFTGRRPGGPSRWSRGRPTAWIPVEPRIVIEVGFDHVTAGRFRHGTRALRFRPDKAPAQCTIDQLLIR